MDYPFGHSHHHNYQRRDDDESPYPPQQYPPPAGDLTYPPPPPQSYLHAPPPSHVTSSYHHNPNYPPPPPQEYQHQPSFESEGQGPHGFSRPHMPAFIEGHFHHGGGPGGSHQPNYPPQPPPHVSESGYGYDGGPPDDLGFLVNKQTCKVVSKAGGHQFAVAIRDHKLVLTYADPQDQTQHWIKDERYSTKVKDADGCPSFALVNRATGQAVKHSVSGHPVQLVAYKPNVFDESILWTESKDLGDGFRTIRMVNNVKLVMDAFHGDKAHGGVHDGTMVALYESWKGDNRNQQWKIVPY